MPIRKITIGLDYKNGMNYCVGQPVLGGSHTIHCIAYDKQGVNLEIYIENTEKEITLWKSYNPSVPTSLEYNINY